ncbi:hypothetical protein [Anaerophilus nitritogenes]|uniref:hypothetical protein n=1 Tax=Anaerophilus nitritogenes TaxID=2498136 RepID=UPI00101D0D90|nr:hypothetical protein [Anaerophilus nitritogenes]
MYNYLKRIIFFTIVFALFCPSSYAQNSNITLSINNRKIETEHICPFVDKQNRLFIPSKFICTYFNLQMDYDPYKKIVTLTPRDGSKKITTQPLIQQNHIFLPVNIIHNLGGHAEWNKQSGNVYLTTKEGLQINHKKEYIGKEYELLFESMENTFFYPKMKFKVYIPKGTYLNENITYIEGTHERIYKEPAKEELYFDPSDYINCYLDQFLFDEEEYYTFTATDYMDLIQHQYKINTEGEKIKLRISHHKIPYPLDFVFSEFNPYKIVFMNKDQIHVVKNQKNSIIYQIKDSYKNYYFIIDKKSKLILNYRVDNLKTHETDYVLELAY